MPDLGERVRALLVYAANKYPGVDAGEACERAAAATCGYSFQGYCAWGENEERAAVDAAVDAAVAAARVARLARFAVVESVMLCRARQTEGRVGAFACELSTIPSGVMEIVAAAMLRV